MIRIPIAADFLTASILTLAIPLAVVILITIWYGYSWRRGLGQR